MNGRKPDVSRRHCVLALLLEVGEKCKDAWRIQVRQVEFRQWPVPARREKTQEQDKAVAVTLDRVATHSTKIGQMVGEVVAHYGAEQVRKCLLHRCPLSQPGKGTTSSP